MPRSQAAELRQLLALRDAARALLAAEAASADDSPELGGLRAELGRRYDSYFAAYGPLNRFSLRRTGRTNPATGEPVMARIRPPQGGFATTRSPRWSTRWRNSTRPGSAPPRRPSSGNGSSPRALPRLGADTPADALAICLDACGEVRLGEIARLLGTTEDDAREQLGTLVFDEPGTGRLVPAAEYLSGKVRDKLRAAEQRRRGRSRGSPSTSPQLRQVIPADLTPGRDRRPARRGLDRRRVRPAVPARDSSMTRACRSSIPAARSGRSAATSTPCLAASTWGTSRYPAPQLAQAVLEQRKIEVRDTVTDTAGQERSRAERGRDPGRAGEGRRAGRAVLRLGLGRPGPRRRAGPHLQRPVQQPGAAQLRRRPAVAARPGADVPAPRRTRSPRSPG